MSSTGYVFGFIGAALMVASYMMKNMLPLRMVALSANVFLVVYAVQGGSWPTVVLYLAMIPINVKKVVQIKKLIRAIENAKADTPISEWLLPHMTRRQAKAGQTLWNKGDKATEMLYIESGRLNMIEYDESLGAGSVLGDRPVHARQPAHAHGDLRNRLHAVQPVGRDHGPALLPKPQAGLSCHAHDRGAPDARHRPGAQAARLARAHRGRCADRLKSALMRFDFNF